MAKKCQFEKTKRLENLIKRYKTKREEIIKLMRNPDLTFDQRLEAYRKLAKLPRDASPTRYRNRCALTGRPRGYMRKFCLSRITFRELALEGKLPGVTKSSW